MVACDLFLWPTVRASIRTSCKHTKTMPYLLIGGTRVILFEWVRWCTFSSKKPKQNEGTSPEWCHDGIVQTIDMRMARARGIKTNQETKCRPAPKTLEKDTWGAFLRRRECLGERAVTHTPNSNALVVLSSRVASRVCDEKVKWKYSEICFYHISICYNLFLYMFNV